MRDIQSLNLLKKLLNMPERDRNNHFFFVGSGISYNSGLPSWEQFIFNCLKEAMPLDQYFKVDDVSKVFGVGRNSTLLIEVAKHRYKSQLKNEGFSLVKSALYQQKKDVQPTIYHYLVVHIAKFFEIPIVTTNYDVLLEKAAADSGVDFRHILSIKKDYKSILIENLGFSLLYLHGRVGEGGSEDPGKTVDGSFSYFDEYNRANSEKDKIFVELLRKKKGIFLGVGLNDDNVNRLIYKSISQKKKEPKPNHIWFCRDYSQNEFQRNLHSKFWNLLGIEPVYCGQEFQEAVCFIRRIHSYFIQEGGQLEDSKSLAELISKKLFEAKSLPAVQKCMLPFDNIDFDVYIANPKRYSIEYRRLASTSESSIDEKCYTLNRDFTFKDLELANNNSVIGAADSLRVQVRLPENTVMEATSTGYKNAKYWGYIGFPIFHHKIGGAISVVVLKYRNKKNWLGDGVGAEGLSEGMNHAINQLGKFISDIFAELL